MDKVLQTLAGELIASVRCLEKGKASSTQEREKSLQTILKVFELRMELNKKIIHGIFFASLNLFAEKEILESELILLLKVFVKILENYSMKEYFLNKSNENNNLIAFLVKLSIPYLKSQVKEIAFLTSLLLMQIARYLDLERLKAIFPALCSTYLQVILEFDPKTSKKTLMSCIEFLIYSFEKLFSDQNYKSKKESLNLQDKIQNITFAISQSISEKPKSANDQTSNNNEENFYQEARKILISFCSILSEKAYKLPKSAKLNQLFVELLDIILNKCSKFFQLDDKKNFITALNCYLYFIALNDQKPIAKLEVIKLFPNLKYEMKTIQLKLLKETPKLLNEVETNNFLAHFKRLNVGFEILSLQNFITYTPYEITEIIKIMKKTFHLNFKGQIIVNDNSFELDYENLKNKILTSDYMTQSFHQYSKGFNSFILEYLPICNFEEEVFKVILKMFSSINGTLAQNIIENLHYSLIENKFPNVEEALTVLFLLSILIEQSKETELNVCSILEHFLSNPLQNIELSDALKSKEQKLLIEQLTTSVVFFSYQKVQKKSPILTSRVIIFLFGKFHHDHKLQRFLVWNCLIQIAKTSFAEIRTFEDFIKFYSETLIRNFIDKLKMIHLIHNPELPFNLLKAFIWFADSNSFLKYSENLITHLNRHFDKFYLREDFKTIKLIFPFYKTIIEAISTEFTRDSTQAQKVLKNSNLIRRALLRIKPFILNRDRYLCHFSLQIFKASCLPLSCLPMEREEANQNFSPDDPENVSIPESLGPVLWEIFHTIAYKLKKRDHPAIMLECLEFLRATQNLHKTFLSNERRFEKEVFPSILNYFFSADKDYVNNLELRMLESTCLILMNFEITKNESNKPFIEQIQHFILEVNQKVLKKTDNNKIVESIQKNLDKLEKLISCKLAKFVINKAAGT